MKNTLIKFSALVFLLFTTQVYSNPISKINFIGLNNSSESSLLEVIPFEIGQNFSPYASDKIIESLFKTGLFENISIIENDNSLNISLKENPNIKYFEIKLNDDAVFSNWIKGEKMYFTSEALKELQNENQLSTGDIYTKRKLTEFVSLLESKYSESGYYNSQISQSISIDDQNRAGIELDITQGDRVKIDTFTITGSNKITEKDLLKLFKIGEADMALINYFTNKDNFTDAEFARGIDLMTNAYFDSGYLDFKILNIDSILDENKEKISINIEITEGIQYKLGEVSFDGELGKTKLDDLNNAISLNKGEVFNRNSIIQNIQSLTDVFADEGYAFVEINPVTSEFLDSVNINFLITLNKKVYINRITILGNTRTQDEVIRREIGVSEGGLYSRSVLRKSLLKLRRLGYFSDVQIATAEVDEMPDKIDISFAVVETQTGSVSFSMSHSNNYGVSFGAGIEEKNIFGYGVPLSDDTRINSNLEFSKNDIKCSSLFSGTGYESSQCATKSNDEFKANINWSKNTLNNYLYPTEGISNSLSAGISLPLGDYRYFNISADHSSYAPINNTTTLKLTGNLNLSKGYSGKELPFYKRHFGGGSGSVRGFGNKTLGPLYPNGKAKGGELSILGSANLITPAFFFENSEKMRMSAFIDAGNIYEKSSNIKLGDIRMSVGFGFAYLSPIGSIGAFMSTPILKKSGDIIEDFGFSIGTGF